MAWLKLAVFVLYTTAVLAADDLTHSHHDGSMYARDLNDVTLDGGVLFRDKRQAQSSSERYHVNQCSYDNRQCCTEGPSIEVLGVDLQFADSVLTAAKLVHRMIRFMPRSLFMDIINSNTSIGLFSASDLPLDKFDEYTSVMTPQCRTSCSAAFNCSQWCTTSEYPNNPNYHLNFLWAYGNATRMYAVETNVVCRGFNTGQNSENFFMREFGFMLMTRVFGEDLLSRIETAYQNASTTDNWGSLVNKYHYFMKATQIWFDGITRSAGIMPCLHAINGPRCDDLYAQRQHLKQYDPKMYDILNHVYNDNRDYLNGDTSLCKW